MTYSPTVIVHIIAGSVGLLSGAAALFSRKGSRLHRVAGNTFFAAMLIIGIGGAYLAFKVPRMLSVVFGILAFYLVASSWLTVKKKNGMTKGLEFALFVVALVDGVGGLYLGWEAAHNATGLQYGGAAGSYYVFGSVALLAAALDLKMFICGDLVGAQRIVRHLWRMCFSLILATIALFLGQQQLFSAAIREMNILPIPTLLVFMVMIYWLVKIQFFGWFENKYHIFVKN